MTSRTASPLRARTSSPGWIPVEAAGEPGATATTRAGGMPASYGTPGSRALVGSERVGRYPRRGDGGFADRRRKAGACDGDKEDRVGRTCAARATPRLLRRGRDGDQGLGVDGPGVRAARVLLPRDRPQPARGRPVPRA